MKFEMNWAKALCENYVLIIDGAHISDLSCKVKGQS